MQDTQLSQISNFIWGVADDLLRDLYVRGKYRDVILPMTVLRRLDAVLEPTKQKVLDEKKWADDAGIDDQAPILEDAAGQSFYNTSQFGLKDLTSRASQQQLRDDFNAYLDGFSPNVQDILDKFEFRHHSLKASTIVSWSLPVAVAVSKSSDRDRNSTPARCRPSITCSPWVSPLESRSMWVTTRVSPSTTRSNSSRRPPRSSLAPLASSARIFPREQPARTSRSTCRSRFLSAGSLTETLA